MTTTPKSKCCGADAIQEWQRPDKYRCLSCGELCDLQDQPDPRLDEVTEKCRATIAEPCTGKECVDAIKLAIQEYTSDLHQSLTKANEELVELRKDQQRLDWLESDLVKEDSDRVIRFPAQGRWLKQTVFQSDLRQAIDSAIAAQEKVK